MLNKYNISIYLMLLSTNIIAQDNYFCYYNPDSPSCTSSPTSYTTNTKSSDELSALFLTNKSYMLNAIDSFSYTSKKVVKTVIQEDISAGSSQEVIETTLLYVFDEQKIKNHKNTFHIESATLINQTTKTLFIPISFELNPYITYSANFSYVLNSLTNTQGLGDSFIGVKICTDELDAFGNFDTSLHLSIPTGDEKQGLGVGEYIWTFNLSWQKYMKDLSSKVSLSYAKDIAFNSEYATIKYAQSHLLSLHYDYEITNNFQLNTNYTLLAKESTYIADKSQKDGGIYHDLFVGVGAADIFKNSNYFNNFNIHLGVIYPLSVTYANDDVNYKTREISYYLSLQKQF